MSLKNLIQSLSGKKERHPCISIQTETECTVPLGLCHIVIGEGLKDKRLQLEISLTKFEREQKYIYCTEKERKQLRNQGNEEFEKIRNHYNLVIQGEVVYGARSAFNLLMDKIKEPAVPVLYPNRKKPSQDNWKNYISTLVPWYSDSEGKFLIGHKPIKKGTKGIILRDNLYDDACKFIKDNEFIEKLGKMKDYRDHLKRERGQNSLLVYIPSTGDIILFPEDKIKRTKEL